MYAGQAADLVTLAGGKSLDGEDAQKGAVARFGVSAAAEAVNDGLTKSVEFTAQADLGATIADRLGTFKAAADGFAPPTMLAELATAVDPATLSANARRVSAAATPLAHLLLTELQTLLNQRTVKLSGQRRITVIAVVAAGVVGLGMAYLAVFVRPRTRRRGEDTGEVTAGHARLDNLPLGSLTYARELLDAEALVHAGRSGPRGRGDAPRTRGDGDAR